MCLNLKVNEMEVCVGYSVERPLQVWNDKSGDRYEIGPDRDGLDLIEIRVYSADGKVLDRVSMPREVWNLLRDYSQSHEHSE